MVEYENKACAECGSDFKPKTANAKYCGDACKKAVALRRSKAQYKKTAPVFTEDPDPEPKIISEPVIPDARDVVPVTEVTTPPGPKGEGEPKPEKSKFRGFFYTE